MRRLVLALTVCALALLGASSASASPPPRYTITVRASGRAPIRVLLRVEGKTRVIGQAHGPGTKRKGKVTVRLNIPKHLPSGRWPVIACVSRNCKRISWLGDVGSARHGPPLPGPSGNAKTTPPPAAPPTTIAPAELGNDIAPPPISTVPTDPLSNPVDEPFLVNAGSVSYYAFVPASYDPTNQTATPLLVWAHGCSGKAEGEAWVVDPDDEEPQDWLTLSLAGRESPGDECWVPSVDEAKVMAALADFETHFNVNRQRVILGGYSSGGDLAYRTGFRHSSTFAGLLIENSSPFRDTESTEVESLDAATTKFPIVHLAHAQDDTYKLGEVEPEIAAVRAAGFPVEFIVRPGGHSDSHTDEDLRTYLLPHIDAGRPAP
jgi:hypothetical protein